MIRTRVGNGESSAFETTLSGRTYASMIPVWREQGYPVRLLLPRLSSPESAIERFRQRVVEGGHNIPGDVIRRRFDAGFRNFETIYRDLVDEWSLYDSSGGSPTLVARSNDYDHAV